MPFCRSCGAQVGPETFCRNCGATQSDTPPIQTYAPPVRYNPPPPPMYYPPSYQAVNQKLTVGPGGPWAVLGWIAVIIVVLVIIGVVGVLVCGLASCAGVVILPFPGLLAFRKWKALKHP